jgi:plastocyanin
MMLAMRVLAVAIVLVALLPAAASAEQVIYAQTIWRFDASTYTIDQGDTVRFVNGDTFSPGPHDVTANDNGPDGKPLFASKTIPAGQDAGVTGAEQLKTGSYGFICTVHSFMTATLVVTDKGTPAAPGPSPAADTRAPFLRVVLRKASRDAMVFAAAVTSNEHADLSARLSARVSGRTFTVGTASVLGAAADKRVRLRIRASKAARRRLRHARRAALTLAVEARDAAGNVGTGVARRKLSRRLG